MINRKTITDKLADCLTLFSRKIEILSSSNDLSWNTHAENVLIPLLNIVFDSKFKNLNIENNANHSAIDLGDLDRKIAIQITSTNSFSKIKTTIEKFIENQYYETFDSLKFVFLKEKGKVTLTKNQINELEILIDNKFIFEFEDELHDFSKLVLLTQTKELEDLEFMISKLDLELGQVSGKLLNNGPVTTLVFDELNELDLAYKVVKGLNELGISVRHYSQKLFDLQKEKLFEQNNCLLLNVTIHNFEHCLHLTPIFILLYVTIS